MSQKSLFRKISRIAILAVASMVFWIYLGSLINFHQHHIFGRNLMPQGILAKREESVLAAAANLHAFPVLFSLDFLNTGSLLESPVELSLLTEPGICSVISIKSGLPIYHSLRGPPAV